jgi:uracil-DNA glycosylase family 4
MTPADPLRLLGVEIAACARCPRLCAWCAEVARVKRRAYRDEEYWGRPVAGFGDPAARMLVVGLAPGAHGANRTGRVFTGDSSGDFLYRALHETGYANQPTSTHAGDGLQLTGAWVSAAARCAPPDNRPTPEELANCRTFLRRELELLRQLRVVVALGRIGFEAYLALLRERGIIAAPSALKFAHGAEYALPGAPVLIASYHPSRQNTQTGRLTAGMLRGVFEQARAHTHPAGLA